MVAIERILVGLDLGPGGTELSSGAHLAAEQARQLAHRLRARLLLVHAAAGDEHVGRAEGARILRTEAGIAAEARRAIEQLAERLRAEDLTVQVCIDEALPAARAIAERVTDPERDLVVTSKRSASHFDLDDRRIGSVALALLRSCPSAVWTVKPGTALPPRRILAATDRSEDVGRRVVVEAARLCRLLGAELTIVHALTPGLGAALFGTSDDKLEEQRRRAVADLEALREDLGTDRARVEVLVGEPIQVIHDAARRLDADLVVMGTRSRQGLAGVLIGNTAERVISEIDRSLLTIKPRIVRDDDL